LTPLTLALGILASLSLAVPGTAAPRGTLTIGIPTDVTTLDPTMAPEVNSLNVAAAVLEPLLRLDARERLQPLLAESWEVVDAVTYVFRLRRGVSFHNGEPLTGRAVEASWRRSQEKHRANREAFSGVARIDHLDDHTIRVVTRAPDPLFLRRMATAEAAIFPPRYTAEQGDQGVAQRPVGTGPFRLAEWVRGERIVFRASPAYHQPDVPRVQTLVWRVVPETASRVAALRTGQLDIALRIPPHQALPLEREPGVRLSSALSTRTFYVAFNTVTTGRGTPVMDRRVRLALNLAVDVEAIVKGLFLGQAERVNSLIGNVQFGHDPTLPPLPYDPARARALLAEAGHGDGFRTGMACPSGAYPYDREACQAVAGYLHKLGVEVDLQVMEPNRFWDLQAKRRLPPLFLDGVGDRFQDPDTQLEGILSPESPWTAFEKAEFTELIRDAGRSVDPAHRRRIYARLARAMQADPPAIFLWQAKNFEGVRPRVSGYATRPSEAMSHVAYDVSVVD
jgi:peptide/nickel transport system substrate-binding protein